MRNGCIRALVCGTGLAFALAAGADERGTPIFGDTFDAAGTFAENWVSKSAQSVDGAVRISNGGFLQSRTPQPLEFVAEADICLTPEWARPIAHPEKGAWAGFFLGGGIFSVDSSGTTFMVWRNPTEPKASYGKKVPLANYVPGSSLRLRLVRRIAPTGVRYVFTVNGQAAGDCFAPLPKKVRSADGGEIYEPLRISSYNMDFETDNYGLFALRHEDDSPNMVINSGFEYDEDGRPPYYCFRGRFPFGEVPYEQYETRFLPRFRADAAERHSGCQSLCASVGPFLGESVHFDPWQVGVVKGQPGVFSFWAKTDIPGHVKIEFRYGSARATVAPTAAWARYEVCCTNLPAKGIYSHASIRLFGFKGHEGHVWFDDLQAEIVPMPEGGRFDPKKTYATKYLPSQLDSARFGAKIVPERAPTIAVPKLPAGVKPTADLDAWTKDAAPTGPFWLNREKPKCVTRAWVACDDENFYIAMRNVGEDASLVARPPFGRPDAPEIYLRDSIELFFRLTPEGGQYHLCAGANGDRSDLYGSDFRWNGSWRVEARANAAAGSVDYCVTLPFADFTANGFSGHWIANLCRNDRHGAVQAGAAECVSSARVESRYFQDPYWGVYELPADVAAKWTARAAAESASRTGGKPRILGRLDYYMNEPEAKFRVWDAKGKMTEHALDIRTMPCGTNKVTVAGMPTEVVKLPYRTGATQVNRFTRSLVHDGVNQIVTGIFVGDNNFFLGSDGEWRGMLDLLKARGFRHTMILSCPKRTVATSSRHFIDFAAERGLLVCHFSRFSEQQWYHDKRNVPWSELMTEPECVAYLDRPNVIQQMVLDEPELGIPADTAKAYMIRMKRYFPYVPCMMNNTVLGIPSRYADLETDTLQIDDFLTNNEGRSVASVIRHIDEMTEADPGKPRGIIIAADCDFHYKCPSYAEQVAQSWGCLCAGATSLYWYILMPSGEGSWMGCVDVTREAQALAPVLLSEEVCEPATATEGKTKLRHMTKKLNGDWYILSCNIDTAPLDEVTFTLPKDAPQEGTVEVLFENRTLPLKDGVFRDGYAGHARHLYRIGK